MIFTQRQKKRQTQKHENQYRQSCGHQILLLTAGSFQHRGHSTLLMPWTHCPTMGGRSRAVSVTGLGTTDGSGLGVGATFGVAAACGGITTPTYAMRASCTYCLRVLPRYAARDLQSRSRSGSTLRRFKTAISSIVHDVTVVSSGTGWKNRSGYTEHSTGTGVRAVGFAAASMAKSLSLLACSAFERMCWNSPDHNHHGQ